MASKDVTSVFGSTRFVLPLILIFFIGAGSAIACPKHKSTAAHRTKSLNTRTVSYLTPVVITYGGRCADTRFGTRRVKHVSVRDNGYYEGGTRYVAVRRSVPRTRYVAVRDDVDYVPTRRVRYVVRDDDYDYAPRYVAVRRKPVYIESGTRYVAVRNYAPKARLVAVHHRDIGDVSYVATQRVPVVDDYFDRVRTTRAVAVSYVPRTGYVTVRDRETGCARVVTCRSSFDDVETTSMRRIVYRDRAPYISDTRHVVVKSDFIDGTEEVVYSRPNYDDSAYLDLPDAGVPVTSDVSYNDMDDVGFDHHAAMYNDATYVTDDDIDAECLPEALIDTSHDVATRSVSYIPVHGEDDLIGGDDAAYVADDVSALPIRYVSAVDDSDRVDTDTMYVSDDEAICPDDDADYDAVSFIPAPNVDHVSAVPVNYVPVETVRYVPVERVVYVPVDTVDLNEDWCDTTVSNIGWEPASFTDLDDVDTIARMDDAPMFVDSEGTEFVPVADSA